MVKTYLRFVLDDQKINTSNTNIARLSVMSYTLYISNNLLTVI